MNKKNKKVTLDSLNSTVNTLSNKVDKLTSAMVAGFKRMDKGFKDAKEDNESLARMVASGFEHTGKDIFALKNNMAMLEQGQENILLKLDYLAPQFEVRQLTRRVKRLEDKVGIRHSGGR